MLLAEELFLLAHDDDSGKRDLSVSRDLGLAAGLLLELADRDLLVLAGRSSKDVTAAGNPPDEPLLAAAHAALLADKPRRAESWLGRLPRAMKPLVEQVGESLVARGVLTREEHRTLGIVSTTRWPEADPAPERELRARLATVLVQGADPDQHVAGLIGLLDSMNLVNHLLKDDDHDRDRRKLAVQRAKDIGKGERGGKARQPGTAAQAVQRGVRAAVAGSSSAASTAAISAAT